MKLQDSKTYIADLDTAIEHSVNIDLLQEKKILITGATGTIGSFIVDMLLRYNQKNNANVKICLAGRNIEKLKTQYEYWNEANLCFVTYDITRNISFEFMPDYIIHAAGNAHPSAFNRDPVGTIMGNVVGTFNLLEYGRACGTKRLLYISSGEVYGQGDLFLDSFDENYAGYIDTTSPRSCYPMSKRATENLCASYSKQYGMETVIARLCHTYGPKITPTDSRANVQFIRNALNNEDIVLKSAGSQMRSYNYVGDCASGIITVLINGESGEAYNIANPDVRITIAQLAEIIASTVNRKIVFADPDANDIINRTPIAKQVLCSRKLESLGWKGSFSAEIGIEHTLGVLSEVWEKE